MPKARRKDYQGSLKRIYKLAVDQFIACDFYRGRYKLMCCGCEKFSIGSLPPCVESPEVSPMFTVEVFKKTVEDWSTKHDECRVAR